MGATISDELALILVWAAYLEDFKPFSFLRSWSTFDPFLSPPSPVSGPSPSILYLPFIGRHITSAPSPRVTHAIYYFANKYTDDDDDDEENAGAGDD